MYFLGIAGFRFDCFCLFVTGFAILVFSILCDCDFGVFRNGLLVVFGWI